MKRVSKSPAAPGRKRVLLVDDHPLVREGIVQWIQRSPDLEVTCQAESASQALALAEKAKPDLVLTDISLPGRSGLELIKDLHALQPELPVLVLSMHEESLYAARALRAGARGYVMKSAGGEQVVDSIRAALQGRIVVSPKIATLLLEEYAGTPAVASQSAVPRLTDREFEVLQLFGDAKTNREIASQLHLSPKTVETHRLHIMDKLKLTNAAELLRFALQFTDREPSAIGNGSRPN